MTKPRKTAKATGSAADFIPPRPTLSKLRAASKGCRGCHLFKLGTQTVFGEGPSTATVMVVGEQPGDQEDKAGRPFVGPSGKLLDRAFDAAGIAREDVYVTNAVKHFKWAKDARSKRRIHQTPNAGEVKACHPWLAHEIAIIKPQVIVCLGATAAKSLLGRSFSVMKARGVAQKSDWAPAVFATVHPSAVLRAPKDQRIVAERLFIADVRKVGRYLDKHSGDEKAVDSRHAQPKRLPILDSAPEARRPGSRARH
jgi:uracil-DNA glycosylase family protein